MHPTLLEGRYRLDERIDVGASAEVWRATDERLRRRVAVKLLHRHLLPDDSARARLQREARAAGSLSHPGIVAVHDVVAADDRAAIVLELVEGESVAARLTRKSPLAWREAARIGADVADALDHAHARGIVHRDVKPANILLGRDGRTRLTDFGIARFVADQEQRVTAPNLLTGTLRYLPPEQLSGGDATPAGDIYALGVVLYEMLAGRPPFTATTPVALAAAQRTPPGRPKRVPDGLWQLVASAIAFDPRDRPASAASVARALHSVASGLPDDALAALPDAPTVVVHRPEAPRDRSADRVGARRGRALIAAEATVWAVALLILVGAVLGRDAAGGPGPATPTPSAAAQATLSATTDPAEPSKSATPATPSPSPTPTATPKPHDVADAYATLVTLVADAEERGTIDRRAADELTALAGDVIDKIDDGKRRDVEKALGELRDRIREHARRDRIESSALTSELLAATDALAEAWRLESDD